MKHGDFLGRHLVTCVYSLVRRQGSHLVQVRPHGLQLLWGCPTTLPSWKFANSRCPVPPHLSVTLGMLSEIRETIRLWRWTLTAAGSLYTLDQVLQCSGAHWRTGPWYSWLQGRTKATMDGLCSFSTRPLLCVCFSVTTKNPDYQLQSLPTLQRHLIELWLIESCKCPELKWLHWNRWMLTAHTSL